MNVALTQIFIFSDFLKTNSNGKMCSVLYCFSVLCNFLERDLNVKPAYGKYHKVFWKPCMKWKSHLKDFSWYKIELCVVIWTRVMNILMNQNEG